MTPKANGTDIIAVRVMREQRWAYERRLEHLSYPKIRNLANRSERDGGLGYDLSEHALKGLVSGYIERMREVDEVDLAEHRARELADLDLEQRRLDLVASLAAESMVNARAIQALDVHAGKLVIGATRERRAVGESRRKLLGLDAAQRIEADVTVHNAIDEELNAMLARLDPPKGQHAKDAQR